MKYRINPKNGDNLSILGFGCMRFPKSDEEMERQIIYAIENGMNFFDTAYIYPNSEARLGRVLSKGYRNQVKISTKLPPYLVNKYEDLDKIFYEHLNRLNTNYIDYYFIHMITDISVWNRLIDLGIEAWIEEKKKKGEILNIGFSYHGGRDEFLKIIDAYDWEFTMIQYNYLDENHQAGRSGLEYASSKGLPVFIMEPLRGGKLVTNLPREVYELFEKVDPKKNPAEWALSWLWNHPEITVVFSGMNTLEMIKENINTASTSMEKSFTEKDYLLFENVKAILQNSIKIPCTSCNYCLPCPVSVDIPTCFSCYNNIQIEGKFSARIKYIMQTSMKSKPQNASLCIKCGKCEKHCPQNIKIMDDLDLVSKDLEGLLYKPIKFILKKFMKL